MKLMFEEVTKQKHQTDREINAMETEHNACSRTNNITHTEWKVEPPNDREDYRQYVISDSCCYLTYTPQTFYNQT